MTFEILSTPVNSPASLIFQQCLAEVDPENRSLNSAMNEVGGYFLYKSETSPLSNELWNKVLDQTKNETSLHQHFGSPLRSRPGSVQGLVHVLSTPLGCEQS